MRGSTRALRAADRAALERLAKNAAEGGIGVEMQTSSENGTQLSLLDIEALLKRGLTNATIDAAGFSSLSAEQVLEILKFNLNKSGGLGIPFRHPTTGETRFIRVRPYIAPIIDGKPAKYLSPKGAGNLLYFPLTALIGSRIRLNPSIS